MIGQIAFASLRRAGLMLALVLAAAWSAANIAGPGLTPAAQAHSEKAGKVKVIHPWAEPAAKGAAARAHPTLQNTAESQAVLTDVDTPVAKRVEMVAGGENVRHLAIPAGGIKGPEQFHLRLVELTRALADGGHFTATLHFADGQKARIRMVVGQDTMSPEG